MKYIAIFVILMIPITVCAAMTATESRTLEIPAEGVEKTVIKCGAGFLKVNGEEGLTSIMVNAEIAVENLSEDDLQEFIDRNIILTLEKKGHKAVLKSEVKEILGVFRKTIKNVRIDLMVRVPKEMHLKISDGSGSIEVANLMGDMKIDDGSGSIAIAETDGFININDGSGSISASQVGGGMDIDDGSGSIDLQHIGGSMKINDGSGSIAAQDINGDVSINDGSGEIGLKTVNGNVIINDGSGSIELRLITGNVSIKDGSGGIDIDGVEQDVNILAAGSGTVVTKNVKGNVSQLD